MISAIKGMNDLFGEKAFRWGKMEEYIRKVMLSADFGEIRTPVLEEIALFKRGVGETTDVVKKEMYDFLDKKGRHVAMRPEGTASVVRAFIEHSIGINYPAPFKAFYIAPFFRYERPQKGRFRQFHQFGVEIFGDETPQMDAEMIFTASRVLKHFGIDYEIHLNSIGCKKCRAAYREKLIEYFSARKDELCEDCRTRLEVNPLRLLDCKACDPKCRCADVPKMTDYLCDDCRNHFEELQKALHAFGVPFVLDPFIVRGLDYYTKTAFEIVAKTGGSQNAVAGGGRYDNLVSDIGGNETPATGFAMGLERLFDLIPEDFYKEEPLLAGYALCDEAVLQLVEFTKKISPKLLTINKKLRFLADYKPKKLKKALQKAEKTNATFVFVIGEDEAANGKILMKNMATREQTLFDKDDISGIIASIKN